MARGDKTKYTERQRRKAEHIEEGYVARGASPKRAAQIGWATVNKEEGGGNKSGSGRGVKDTKVSSRRGGKIGGKASAARPAAARSASAKKAATTRKANAAKSTGARAPAKKKSATPKARVARRPAAAPKGARARKSTAARR